MPKVKIDIRRGRTGEEKQQIMDAIHDALVESIKIPKHDRLQILHEHDADQFMIPEGKSERFTLVEISMYPGRSIETKRLLLKTIAKKLEEIGIQAHDTMVILNEPPLDHWGVDGKPASEMQFGYRLDV